MLIVPVVFLTTLIFECLYSEMARVALLPLEKECRKYIQVLGSEFNNSDNILLDTKDHGPTRGSGIYILQTWCINWWRWRYKANNETYKKDSYGETGIILSTLYALFHD